MPFKSPPRASAPVNLGGSSVVQGPPPTGRTDLLLRFFESQFFDEWIALTCAPAASIPRWARPAGFQMSLHRDLRPSLGLLAHSNHPASGSKLRAGVWQRTACSTPLLSLNSNICLPGCLAHTLKCTAQPHLLPRLTQEAGTPSQAAPPSSGACLQVPVQEQQRRRARLPVQPAVQPAGDRAGALPVPAVPAADQQAPHLFGRGRGQALCQLPAHRCQGGLQSSPVTRSITCCQGGLDLSLITGMFTCCQGGPCPARARPVSMLVAKETNTRVTRGRQASVHDVPKQPQTRRGKGWTAAQVGSNPPGRPPRDRRAAYTPFPLLESNLRPTSVECYRSRGSHVGPVKMLAASGLDGRQIPG